MTPNDIVVGEKYKYTKNNNIYLGIGKRQMWTGDLTNKAPFDEKHLVCIESDEDAIGLIVKEGEDCLPGYWDGFIKI